MIMYHSIIPLAITYHFEIKFDDLALKFEYISIHFQLYILCFFVIKRQDDCTVFLMKLEKTQHS